MMMILPVSNFCYSSEKDVLENPDEKVQAVLGLTRTHRMKAVWTALFAVDNN